jgi:alanyl-tRNA synthetase
LFEDTVYEGPTQKETVMAKKTKRLYFDNPYQTEFQADVIHSLVYEGKPAVILDRTCFYPEGGGQPADSGTLNGIPVLHVLEQDDRILHVLEEHISSDAVTGKIDGDLRFDHMQQHAGQHVLSQCFVQLFDAATRSFHMGEETSTLEVDMRNISEEEAERVEKLANGMVFQNKEIKTSFYKEEEVPQVRLRRPPKKTGEIRVVEVSDFDYTACGGTHPRSTGEIGTIKILRWERIRDNVRVEFICGKRALEDYIRKHRDLKTLSNSLTVDDREVVASLEKIKFDLKTQKKVNRKMQEEILRYEADDMTVKTEGKIIKRIFSDRTQEEIRLLTLLTIKKGEFIALFGVNMEERVHVFLASSESLGLDMRELVPIVSPLIDGKGGGRPSLVEISGEKKGNLQQALDEASHHISEKLNNISDGKNPE